MNKTKKILFPLIIVFLLTIIIGLILFVYHHSLFSPRSLTAITANESLPCDLNSAVSFNLGHPHRASREPAEFSTNGGEIYINAKFDHKGIFYSTTTTIYLGYAANYPIFNEQRGTVTNVLQEIHLPEGQYHQVNLNPGNYWLWTSNFAEINLITCVPNIINNVKSVK